MRNQHSHVPDPVQIKLCIDDRDVQITGTTAGLLRQFEDGVYTGMPNPQSARALINRRWVIRGQGGYRLTDEGKRARAALLSYDARKRAAFNRSGVGGAG